MVADEVGFRRDEEVGLADDALADELVQVVDGRDALDAIGVEKEERLLQIMRASAADAGERVGEFFAQLGVLREEAERDVRLLADECASDEKLGRFLHIDAPVINEVAHDFEPVNEHALDAQDALRFRAPVRVGVAVAAKMRADFEHPLGVDARDGAREKL